MLALQNAEFGKQDSVLFLNHLTSKLNKSGLELQRKVRKFSLRATYAEVISSMTSG